MFLFNPYESPSIFTYGQFLRRVPGSFFVGGLTPLLVYRAELPPLGGGTPAAKKTFNEPKKAVKMGGLGQLWCRVCGG